MIFFCVIIVLSVFVANANTLEGAKSEPMFYLGAHIDYNFNMHTANFNQLTMQAPTCCPKYSTANGSGFSIGLLFEKPIKKISESFILGSRLSYSSINAAFAEKTNIGNVELRKTTPPYEAITSVSSMAIYNLKSYIDLINLNLYASNNLFDKFVANLGINIGAINSALFDQWEELSEPKDVVYYENGTRTRNKTTEMDIPNLKRIQLGASVGLGYELPIGKSSYLIPELRYNFTFTNLSDVNWKSHYLQLGAAIKFSIHKQAPLIKEKIIYERDTIIKKRFDIKKSYVELTETIQEGSYIYEKYTLFQPSQANLSTSMEIYGIGNNGERLKNPLIIIEAFLATESFPMLPNIYFNDGSYDLMKTRLDILTPDETTRFDTKHIEANALSVYYNSLNIFAKRMLENSNLKVIVAGYSSGEGKDKNTDGIAISRANSVKNYLVEVWNIPEDRLIVTEKFITTPHSNPKSKDDIDSENRRVELTPVNGDYLSALALFRPIQLTHIERTANPPQIEFKTKIIAEAGIDIYNLYIAQDTNKLRKFSGRESEDKISWYLDETPMPLLESPVVATLYSRDLIGQTQEYSQKINIDQITIQKKKERLEGDWRIERYSLTLFEHDDYNISSLDRQILSEIKSSISKNSKVTISGFADRTGQSQYNKNLAQMRCEEVKKVLDIKMLILCNRK